MMMFFYNILDRFGIISYYFEPETYTPYKNCMFMDELYNFYEWHNKNLNNYANILKTNLAEEVTKKKANMKDINLQEKFEEYKNDEKITRFSNEKVEKIISKSISSFLCKYTKDKKYVDYISIKLQKVLVASYKDTINKLTNKPIKIKQKDIKNTNSVYKKSIVLKFNIENLDLEFYQICMEIFNRNIPFDFLIFINPLHEYFSTVNTNIAKRNKLTFKLKELQNYDIYITKKLTLFKYLNDNNNLILNHLYNLDETLSRAEKFISDIKEHKEKKKKDNIENYQKRKKEIVKILKSKIAFNNNIVNNIPELNDQIDKIKTYYTWFLNQIQYLKKHALDKFTKNIEKVFGNAKNPKESKEPPIPGFKTMQKFHLELNKLLYDYDKLFQKYVNNIIKRLPKKETTNKQDQKSISSNKGVSLDNEALKDFIHQVLGLNGVMSSKIHFFWECDSSNQNENDNEIIEQYNKIKFEIPDVKIIKDLFSEINIYFSRLKSDFQIETTIFEVIQTKVKSIEFNLKEIKISRNSIHKSSLEKIFKDLMKSYIQFINFLEYFFLDIKNELKILDKKDNKIKEIEGSIKTLKTEILEMEKMEFPKVNHIGQNETETSTGENNTNQEEISDNEKTLNDENNINPSSNFNNRNEQYNSKNENMENSNGNLPSNNNDNENNGSNPGNYFNYTHFNVNKEEKGNTSQYMNDKTTHNVKDKNNQNNTDNKTQKYETVKKVVIICLCVVTVGLMLFVFLKFVVFKN